MIDFSKLTMLVGPRFRRIQSERGDREKLAHAHMRRAKGPKNHATNRERSHQDRERAAKAAKLAQQNRDEIEAFKAQVRAYWRGEREDYPSK